MQNSGELEAMLDDGKEKFNEWGSQEIPFFEDLTDEDKAELRTSYEKTEQMKEIWDKTMTTAISHTGNEIDYSTDINKSADQWDQAKQNLEVKVSQLSEKYGKSK